MLASWIISLVSAYVSIASFRREMDIPIVIYYLGKDTVQTHIIE